MHLMYSNTFSVYNINFILKCSSMHVHNCYYNHPIFYIPVWSFCPGTIYSTRIYNTVMNILCDTRCYVNINLVQRKATVVLMYE